MVQKYYLDTSIWVDLYEDRKGYQGEPLGEWAWKLIILIKAKRHKLIITDLLLLELERKYSIEQIKGMFKPFEDIMEKVVASEEQRTEAKSIAVERNVPGGDALHAVLARDNNFILVSRDKHFKELNDISRHYKPEELT